MIQLNNKEAGRRIIKAKRTSFSWIPFGFVFLSLPPTHAWVHVSSVQFDELPDDLNTFPSIFPGTSSLLPLGIISMTHTHTHTHRHVLVGWHIRGERESKK